jgi:hypothetical protein
MKIGRAWPIFSLSSYLITLFKRNHGSSHHDALRARRIEPYACAPRHFVPLRLQHVAEPLRPTRERLPHAAAAEFTGEAEECHEQQRRGQEFRLALAAPPT